MPKKDRQRCHRGFAWREGTEEGPGVREGLWGWGRAEGMRVQRACRDVGDRHCKIRRDKIYGKMKTIISYCGDRGVVVTIMINSERQNWAHEGKGCAGRGWRRSNCSDVVMMALEGGARAGVWGGWLASCSLITSLINQSKKKDCSAVLCKRKPLGFSFHCISVIFPWKVVIWIIIILGHNQCIVSINRTNLDDRAKWIQSRRAKSPKAVADALKT